MSHKSERREFLRLPHVEVKDSLQSTVVRSLDVVPNGPAQVWITGGKRRIAPAASANWSPSTGAPGVNAIVVRPEIKFQEILGFGGAMTGAACAVFHRLPAESRDRLFRTMFHPSELAFNVCRTCIGSSDCSETVYSYDDSELDPDMTRFSIEPDRAHILPMLRQARGVNPDLFLFSSPWSPPGWMKSNGSMKGGCMRHTYMPSYANYFLKFLRAYEEENVAIQAVTIQNEVDSPQDGTMPACGWPQDYEADFLTMHLGPLFQRAGIATKIWIIDHNCDLWGRAVCELDTPDVRKFTNAIAWHGYRGEPAMIKRVHDAYPDVEMYFTECGPDYMQPDFQTDWAKWGKTFSEILKNSCRSITVWTLASDEHGRPYVGGGASGIGGAMLIDSKSGEVTYSGMFWALGHFSKFVRRGARRIDSQGAANGISHCAFENPDGSLILLLANEGSESHCEMVLGNQTAKVVLPGNSFATLTIAVQKTS